jgi:hypothetical protein
MTRPDLDAIAARATAAPGGQWETFTDSLRIPWSVPFDPDDIGHTDDDTDDPWSTGRWIAVREGHWHTGSPDPGPELWQFLGSARADVLELVDEVQRLRAELARAVRPHAPRRSLPPGRLHRNALKRGTP